MGILCGILWDIVGIGDGNGLVLDIVAAPMGCAWIQRGCVTPCVDGPCSVRAPIGAPMGGPIGCCLPTLLPFFFGIAMSMAHGIWAERRSVMVLEPNGYRYIMTR